MYTIFVERKAGSDLLARSYYDELKSFLGVEALTSVRCFNRYDIEGVDEVTFKKAIPTIFCDPQTDNYYLDKIDTGDDTVISWEYLPGQFDQRADAAVQCLTLISSGNDTIKVRCAKVVALKGNLSTADKNNIKNYLINPVDSRLTPETSAPNPDKDEYLKDIATFKGFIDYSDDKVEKFVESMSLAMDKADACAMRDYFKSEGRDPTITEVRVLDTYWSDHCRHTTFLTHLTDIEIEDGFCKSELDNALKLYKDARGELYGENTKRPITLMDAATIGGKFQKLKGILDDEEDSEENNACSLLIDVDINKPALNEILDQCNTKKSTPETKEYLLMFKNETHNHPTEIEPFGGAATCIGGAIRDPLSGRSYVYQSMRVSGAGDPTVSVQETMKGKLPQQKICRGAAQGFSSYGNQVGLATGQVEEYYHNGFLSKRLETGAVIAAAPRDIVRRERPSAGDVVILLGGGTGRDGIGGATGSSKMHTKSSVEKMASEVQKGNAPEERKIQRLFRNKSVSMMIKRSNDFGAGGVSVAIGELAAGLLIDLDKVPKKYNGLDGTELAISESQERMAVVVDKKDVAPFIDAANKENLTAVAVATVNPTPRLVMKWRGKTIVDISRAFLDTAGATHTTQALIKSPKDPRGSPLNNVLESVESAAFGEGQIFRVTRHDKNDYLTLTPATVKKMWLINIGDLACCNRSGLVERFDSTIGSGTVLFPYGGKNQLTPECAMAALIPVAPDEKTTTVSLMAHGYDPRVSSWSAFHGAIFAVIQSLARLASSGGEAAKARLSFQEFFGRARDPEHFGYPAAALLGGLLAQIKTHTACIGGKDSMSGTYTFENDDGKKITLDVPNTLISFAVTVTNANTVTSAAFKKAGEKIYLLKTPIDDKLLPDFDAFNKNMDCLYKANKMGAISAAYSIGSGGIAEAISKMALGNNIGAKIMCDNVHDLFLPLFGSLIITGNIDLDESTYPCGCLSQLGETTNDGAIHLGYKTSTNNDFTIVKITLKDILTSYTNTLDKVYPTLPKDKDIALPSFAKTAHPSLLELREELKVPHKKQINMISHPVKPKVIIPIFYGTNCEYDMERAFLSAGAMVKTIVITNRSREGLLNSLNDFSKELKDAQILALAGGFSAADEPDGSAKFISNCLRSNPVAEEITALINRKSLILGICNGFQALVKTGLVVYGKFSTMTDKDATLTYNTIGRHISRVARTKIISGISPWAHDKSVVDGLIHLIPISHGEGRFVVNEELGKKLFSNGQVFSQYVDQTGEIATCAPDNPNGSIYSIEGITSPDGLILGKMGHNERTMSAHGNDYNLLKNIRAMDLSDSTCENIFLAGVRYFE